MSAIVPVILDSCPAVMKSDGSRGSLLQLPLGAGTLIDEVLVSVAAVTRRTPYILATFAPSKEYIGYVSRLRGVAGLIDEGTLHDPLSLFDASDRLLLLAPTAYPIDGYDLGELLASRDVDARMSRHLLAFEPARHGTRELVQAGTDGRVRRIQRYFAASTWPFTTGVAASIVNVADLMAYPGRSFSSLEELRRSLTESGIPTQDVACRSEVYDLADEAGILAIQEARVSALVPHSSARSRSSVIRAETASVHATARIIGPVMIGEGARVAERALVVGPSIIGAGAMIEAGATVAQCLVMPGAIVEVASTARHRVVVKRDASEDRVFHHTPHRRHAYVPRPTPTATPRESLYLSIRRVVEPIIAGLALIALSPALLVVAIAIKLTSRGPVFFGDRREGKDGKEFSCWKFRSMRHHADVMQMALAGQQYADGPQFKMHRDPRITRLGAKLRSLNIDELPQLYNVVLGQMSFVGPRPSPFRENQICVPWRLGRLSVRPGITGLWQVCRRDREAGDFHQWIFYDLAYVRNVNFLVDLKILVATILTLGGRYPVPMSRIIGHAERVEDTTDAPPSSDWNATSPTGAPADARRTRRGHLQKVEQ